MVAGAAWNRPSFSCAPKERFSDIDLNTAKIRVFGKLSKLSATRHAGDRVEIYRPLLADRKAMRKKRAAEGKQDAQG